MEDLCYLTIAEAATLIHSRKLSPVALTKAYLDRIARVDPLLHSFITISADVAMRQAEEAAQEIARGKIRSLLHGIPVTYKDYIATAGIRTTAASRVYENWIPDKDANVVARLRNAGAITLGKVHLSEFGFSGGFTDADFMKPARNPWNTKFLPGGSSSGSAVSTAAGLAMGSVGGDSGGSIRIPAAYCGVTGIKPTYGLVGRSGEIPSTYSMSHVGPITRTVEDGAIMLELLAGYDPEDRASANAKVPPYRHLLQRQLRGLRVGISPSYMEAVGNEEDIMSAFEAAVQVLHSFGCTMREVVIPHLNYSCAAGYNCILRIEMFHAHLERLRDKGALYGRGAFRNIARGGFLSTVDYLRGQQARTLISSELAQTFEGIDLLLTPTTPTSPSGGAHRSEGTDPKVNLQSLPHEAAYTAPFNLTGNPVISVPCGFNSTGLPIGLQVIGRPFEEPLVLAAAHQYQLSTDWHRRKPPLPS
jgi:aspartyl-tRNA(Asn)/glutamyl-tRNA(Gln) amidotransferase subunit A